MKKTFGRWKYSSLEYSELCKVLANQTEQTSIRVNRGDIDQIMKRFFIRKRKSLSNRLRALNSGYLFLLKKHAKKVESFKKYIHAFAASIDLRINQESTMLLEAFENRGCITYKDTIHLSPMQKLLKSTRFCDPSYHKYEPVPFGLIVRGGYLLSCIRVAFKRHVGLIGWQLVWDGDGLPTVESKTRGPVSGVAVAVTEFEIKPRDFLMAVEYCCESEEIVAIRFKTFLTGWNKWLGSKPSLTAVTIKLGADLPDPDPRGSEYQSSGKDEEKDPALPSAYVIGLLGMESPNKASCIGVVVRRVIRQNVFSYHWCGEGKENRYFQSPMPTKAEENHNEVFDGDFAPLQEPEELISWEDFSREQRIKVAAEIKAKADAEAAAKAEAEAEAAALTAEAMQGNLGQEGNGNEVKNDTKERFLPDIVSDAKASRHGKRSAFGAIIGDGKLVKTSEEEKKVKKKDKDDIIDDDDKPISAAEEVFFDILRMRTIELKALQKRAVDFARRLWFNKTLRSKSKSEPQLSMSLQILKALTKWFFESLSKKLSPLCVAEKEFKHIKRELRSISSKQAQSVFKLASARGSAESHRKSEGEQSWFGKSFMGPQERVQRRKYMERLLELEERVRIVEAEMAETTRTEHALMQRLRELAPRIFLCETFCRNIWIKVSAAKHKKSLLERMTFDALKDQFSSMPSSKHDDGGSKKYGTPSNGADGGGMNNFHDILNVLHRRNLNANDVQSVGSASRKSMEDDFKREIEDDVVSTMASVTLGDSPKRVKKLDVSVPKLKKMNTEPSIDDSSCKPPSIVPSPKLSRSVSRLALPKRGVGGRPITPKRGPLTDSFSGIDDPMNIRRVLAVNTRFTVPERKEEKPASFALKLSQSVKQSRNLKNRPATIETPTPAPNPAILDEDTQNMLDFQLNYASFMQSLDKDMARLNLLKSGNSEKVSIVHLLEKRFDNK
jgi:hypothetical protein